MERLRGIGADADASLAPPIMCAIWTASPASPPASVALVPCIRPDADASLAAPRVLSTCASTTWATAAPGKKPHTVPAPDGLTTDVAASLAALRIGLIGPTTSGAERRAPMPSRILSRCSYPGCPTSVPGQLCKDHRAERPTAAERGYDAVWAKLAKMVLAEEPLCRRCITTGDIEPATLVDHIIPIRERPDLRLTRSNLQPLCRACHDVKTQEDMGGGHRISTASSALTDPQPSFRERPSTHGGSHAS
jgi:5-methylcytosine-specific restriction enzyme A